MLRVAILNPMSKDTQLNIRVEKDLVARLKAQAEIEVTTPSQLVRKAVTIYLREALSDS